MEEATAERITNVLKFLWQKHLELHFGEIATSTSKYKRTSRDLYTVCKITGLDQFTKSYGLTAKEFGENFDSGLVKHSLLSDPDSSPEDLAKDYICIEFPEVEDVLKAAQHMMSKEITHEPTIKQQFKDLYNCYTVLYTKPTDKGKHE